MEAVRDTFLTQHVTELTHYRGSNTPNTLDVIFTNEEGMIENLKDLAPVGKSHHTLLKYNLCCYTKSMYDKGNYDGMIKMMTYRNWTGEIKDKSTQQCWVILEKSIRNARTYQNTQYDVKQKNPDHYRQIPSLSLQSRKNLKYISCTS